MDLLLSSLLRYKTSLFNQALGKSSLNLYFGRLAFTGILAFNAAFMSLYAIASEAEVTVYDINPSKEYFGSARPKSYTEYHGKLYFHADDGVHGQELWVYDGETDTASLVADITPGYKSSITSRYHPEARKDQAFDMKVYQDKLYFSANDGVHGFELWSYDSNTDSATLVVDIYPGEQSSAASDFIIYNNKLYFLADDAEHGRELWVYDNVAIKAGIRTHF